MPEHVHFGNPLDHLEPLERLGLLKEKKRKRKGYPLKLVSEFGLLWVVTIGHIASEGDQSTLPAFKTSHPNSLGSCTSIMLLLNIAEHPARWRAHCRCNHLDCVSLIRLCPEESGGFPSRVVHASRVSAQRQQAQRVKHDDEKLSDDRPVEPH